MFRVEEFSQWQRETVQNLNGVTASILLPINANADDVHQAENKKDFQNGFIIRMSPAESQSGK